MRREMGRTFLRVGGITGASGTQDTAFDKEETSGKLRTVREFGMDMYTVLYLKWITKNGLLYSTEDSAQCCVEVWREGEFGGE